MAVHLAAGAARWCPIVRLELWKGAGGDREKEILREFERLIPEVAMTHEVCNNACDLAHRCRAAGLVDRPREHFETALRQARDVPVRILQPTVLYWYGRSLSSAADGADRLRGRAMVEAALTGFRTLEMVLHANLAEQFLRAGGRVLPATAWRFRPAG